jgi:hypothetical protein
MDFTERFHGEKKNKLEMRNPAFNGFSFQRGGKLFPGSQVNALLKFFLSLCYFYTETEILSKLLVFVIMAA